MGKNLNCIIKLGKDTTKKMQKTNTVYKINCKNCIFSYVERHYNCNSVVSLHENNNQKFDWNNILV